MTRLLMTLFLIVVGVSLVQAQDLTPCFVNLSDREVINATPQRITRPGDGRPWVIVIFKACCATNQRALKWALEVEKIFGDSVGILGINSDNARAISKVKPWLAANRVDFTVFQDPTHEVINALSIIAAPTVIVLDAQGREDFRSAGFFGGSGKVMQEHLRRLLSTVNK